MKNWLKAVCALILTGAMALSAAAAYYPKNYDPDPEVQIREPAVVETFALPELAGAQLQTITSSMASEDIDLTPLYDKSADTTVTFTTAAEGVSISMTSREEFRLAAIVTDDAAYTASVYASRDGYEWVELDVKTTVQDGYAVHKLKNLVVDYKFYRLEAQTDGEELTLDTLAMYAAEDDVWPFAIYTREFMKIRRG